MLEYVQKLIFKEKLVCSDPRCYKTNVRQTRDREGGNNRKKKIIRSQISKHWMTQGEDL